MPTLEFPVTCEIAVRKGKIDFLELLSNEGKWDGKHEGFKLNL